MQLTPSECDNACVFPEITIGDDTEPGSALTPGMVVLAPCERCGLPPQEALMWAETTLTETQHALDQLTADRDMLLFHWTPRARRKQITRYGLRPSMRPTTNAADDYYLAPYICLGDAPSWAWLLSGAQRGSPSGEWDLWQVWASKLTDMHVVPGDVRFAGNGIHEVRTEHRIYKRHLWLVGGRAKP